MSTEDLTPQVQESLDTEADDVVTEMERNDSPKMEEERSVTPDESEETNSQQKPEFVEPAPPQDISGLNKMKHEESKLRHKYPNFKGQSALLAKRMQQRQKFFDSGDYNMAQAKMNDKKKLAPTDEMYLNESLGGAIPTPGTVSQRKASICPDLMHMQFKEHAGSRRFSMI